MRQREQGRPRLREKVGETAGQQNTQFNRGRGRERESGESLHM